MNKLSKTQEKILDFIKERMSEGSVPSIREICSATGLRSTSTVHYHLNILEERGYITKGAGHRELKLSNDEPSISVPVIGRVTAGLPIYAFEDVEGYIPFPKKKAVGEKMFALRVVGESMRDAGIFNGDIVICQSTPTASDGDIVVAMIDDEATVKSFYKEDGRYRLQPHNPDFQPIITDEVQILGRVVSLFREY